MFPLNIPHTISTNFCFPHFMRTKSFCFFFLFFLFFCQNFTQIRVREERESIYDRTFNVSLAKNFRLFNLAFIQPDSTPNRFHKEKFIKCHSFFGLLNWNHASTLLESPCVSFFFNLIERTVFRNLAFHKSSWLACRFHSRFESRHIRD